MLFKLHSFIKLKRNSPTLSFKISTPHYRRRLLTSLVTTPLNLFKHWFPTLMIIVPSGLTIAHRLGVKHNQNLPPPPNQCAKPHQDIPGPYLWKAKVLKTIKTLQSVVNNLSTIIRNFESNQRQKALLSCIRKPQTKSKILKMMKNFDTNSPQSA